MLKGLDVCFLFFFVCYYYYYYYYYLLLLFVLLLFVVIVVKNTHQWIQSSRHKWAYGLLKPCEATEQVPELDLAFSVRNPFVGTSVAISMVVLRAWTHNQALLQNDLEPNRHPTEGGQEIFVKRSPFCALFYHPESGNKTILLKCVEWIHKKFALNQIATPPPRGSMGNCFSWTPTISKQRWLWVIMRKWIIMMGVCHNQFDSAIRTINANSERGEKSYLKSKRIIFFLTPTCLSALFSLSDTWAVFMRHFLFSSTD